MAGNSTLGDQQIIRETDDVGDDRDALVGRLRDFGVKYLSPSDAHPGRFSQVSPAAFIARLVIHPDPRLRRAVIALLLLHPDWAKDVAPLLDEFIDPARPQWRYLYLAAVYLQRLWWTRLALYLGELEPLPDLYAQTLGLPPADERHGKTGLVALADLEVERSPCRFNYLASYHKVLNLLVEHLKLESNHREPTAAG